MEPDERSKQIGANIAVAIDSLISVHIELGLSSIATHVGSVMEHQANQKKVTAARVKLEEVLAHVVDEVRGSL